MRSLVSAVVSELQSSEVRIFHLLDIEIEGTHFRYTDCDIPLVVGGDKYVPRAFFADAAMHSSEEIVDKFTVDVDNVDRVLVNTFVGGSPRNGTLTYSIVLLDENHNIVSYDVLESTLESYWESDSEVQDLQPVAGIGDTVLGMWEYNATTGGIMPSASIGEEDYWEYNETTGGIMPK